MERWAANTLRTLGIILTSGFILISCLFFLLLTVCAAGPNMGESSGSSREAAGYAIIGILIAIAGGLFIAWLARGIFRSQPLPQTFAAEAFATPLGTPASVDATPHDQPEPKLSLPLHLSPLGQQAVNRLVQALAAQIVVSAALWILNQLYFWTAPRSFAPHNWVLTFLAPYILHQIPYAILIYLLLKRPSRLAFTYAIAVPAVLLLQSLFGLSVISAYYIHHPVGFVLLIIPWSLHIVILVMAYKAIQQVGIHPLPSSIIVAAIAAFFYFSLIQSVTTFLYRLNYRLNLH